MTQIELCRAAGYRDPPWLEALPLSEEHAALGYKAYITADPADVYPRYLEEIGVSGKLTQCDLEVARLVATRDLRFWFGPLVIRWKRSPSWALANFEPGDIGKVLFHTHEAWKTVVTKRVGRQVLTPDDAWIPPAYWRVGDG